MPKRPLTMTVYPKVTSNRGFAEEFIKAYWPLYEQRKHDVEEAGAFAPPDAEFNREFLQLILRILNPMEERTGMAQVKHLDALNSIIESMVRGNCPDDLLVISPASSSATRSLLAATAPTKPFKNALISFYSSFNPAPDVPKKMRSGGLFKS